LKQSLASPKRIVESPFTSARHSKTKGRESAGSVTESRRSTVDNRPKSKKQSIHLSPVEKTQTLSSGRKHVFDFRTPERGSIDYRGIELESLDRDSHKKNMSNRNFPPEFPSNGTNTVEQFIPRTVLENTEPSDLIHHFLTFRCSNL
jgi:hypothetical protein